jgi:Nucleoside-diphosphate-sugar epimerases
MKDRELADGVYLVTGAAGFIGCHLSKCLLKQGALVVGVDNLNAYYDVRLKHARLEQLNAYPNFSFIKGDIAEEAFALQVFESKKPCVVVNLAAQAGVQYSAINPASYIKSNIIGFHNILEACRRYPPRHLIYASSSSVYGANRKVPFEESDNTDTPISLYASTKKSNELMAYTYSHLYKIPATGLRFFTVYGPMGRPDMAYFLFTQKYFSGEPIEIFNNGDTGNDISRDFTYIDDIVQGIYSILNLVPDGETPHRLLNIGNNKPEKLTVFITLLECSLSSALGRQVTFKKVYRPLKAGDVPATYASIDRIKKLTGFTPHTSLDAGLQKFAEWYVDYYGVD